MVRIGLLPQMVTIKIPPIANGYHSNINAFKWLPLYMSHVSVISVPVLSTNVLYKSLTKKYGENRAPTANGYHSNTNAFKWLPFYIWLVSIISMLV